MPRSAIVCALTLLPLACGGGESEDTSDTTTFSTTITTTLTTTTLPTTSETGTDSDSGDGDGDASTSPTDTDTTSTGPTDTDDTDDTDDSMGSDSDDFKFDLGEEPDIEPMECIDCALTIDSMQSGTFAISGDAVFATATLMGEDVYALGEYGSGRFIASADSSLPFNEVTDCPLHEWLAGTEADPSVLWFGWSNSDGPSDFGNFIDVEQGIHLPAQYIGNPALLAADFDIVMYTESSGQYGNDQPSDQEMQTLLDYVQLQGGGLYIVSEFFGYLNQADLDSVNRLLMPVGIESEAVSLNWGNVGGNIEFECFPPPVG